MCISHEYHMMWPNRSAVFQIFVLSRSDSKGLQSLISVVLILLCMAMTALGVFVFIENEFGLGEFTEYFVAGYMVLFALLLFLYECMWWCTIDKLNHSIRKNFGFMYGIKGKALYLIFVACLCIGIDGNTLGDKNWLRWVTGIGWGAMGIALLAATIVKPELFENYKTATGGFTDADMTV